jgi:hypothetical protein
MKNNRKKSLTALLSAPHWLAPYQQRSGSGQLGGRGNSLAEEHGGSGSALGSTAAAQQQQRQCGISGGSMVYAHNDCNGNNDNDI